MNNLLLLLLGCAGLTTILVKGQIFKKVRENITLWYQSGVKLRPLHKRRIVVYRVSWFLFMIFGCPLCMGVYSALICLGLDYADLNWTLFVFAGALISALFVSLIQFLERK